MEQLNRFVIENAALNADKIMYRDYARSLLQRLNAVREESINNQREKKELIKLRAENQKLKKSLRKLYEKYIKPTQSTKLDTHRKNHNRDKSLLFGSRYAARPLIPTNKSKVDGVELTAGDRLWATRPYTSSDPMLIGISYRDSDGIWRTIKAAE